eukprot:COSAG02_NODE_68_length_42582_cov_52.351129_19_plen_101_part_00
MLATHAAVGAVVRIPAQTRSPAQPIIQGLCLCGVERHTYRQADAHHHQIVFVATIRGVQLALRGSLGLMLLGTGRPAGRGRAARMCARALTYDRARDEVA